MKFQNGNRSEFYLGLSQTVNAYFKEKEIPKTGDSKHLMKSAFFLSIYLGAYAGIYLFSGQIGLVFLMAMVMGLTGVSIFLTVVHDASHGVFHRNKTLNTIGRYVGEFIGVNTYIWNIRHNMQHHAFTNIVGGDIILSNMPLIRISPHQPHRGYHRFQAYYAGFIYLGYAFFWTFVIDIRLFFKKEICNLKNLRHPWQEWAVLISSKIFFIGYMVILPAILTGISWPVMFLVFLFMQMAGGFLASLIAILPHFVEGPVFREAKEGKIDSSWAENSLETTVDFAPASQFWNWISGAANTHTVHHLFPQISAAHYYALTPIVEKFCKENGYPYSKLTLRQAVVSHFKFLNRLGHNQYSFNGIHFERSPG